MDRLAAAGLIQPVETSREGRRPERTVYEITGLGRDQLIDALRDGLMRSVPDYPGLAMAVTFAQLLDPDEVAELLQRRSIEAGLGIGCTISRRPPTPARCDLDHIEKPPATGNRFRYETVPYR